MEDTIKARVLVVTENYGLSEESKGRDALGALITERLAA